MPTQTKIDPHGRSRLTRRRWETQPGPSCSLRPDRRHKGCRDSATNDVVFSVESCPRGNGPTSTSNPHVNACRSASPFSCPAAATLRIVSTMGAWRDIGAIFAILFPTPRRYAVCPHPTQHHLPSFPDGGRIQDSASFSSMSLCNPRLTFQYPALISARSQRHHRPDDRNTGTYRMGPVHRRAYRP